MKRRFRDLIKTNRWLKYVPNSLTLCNSLCGFLAILTALRAYEGATPEESLPVFYTSAVIICCAMVFDSLDGLAARIFNAASMETHNGCWKAWELLGENHISHPEQYAPRLKERAIRLEVIEHLREFKQNDWNAVLLLEAMESRTAPDAE